MPYYAIAQFDTKKDAEAFAFAQKDTQIEVVSKNFQDNKQIYADIDSVLDHMAQDEGLTENQREQINKELLIDEFYSTFDFSDHDAAIKDIIKEQLNIVTK